MTGPVPQYDADHPPPQWPRFYRPSEKGPEGGKQPATVPGENPLCPEDIPGALGLDAANQFYDHLGKIGEKLQHNYTEGTSSSEFTMSQFFPEKHIYMVHFTWGQSDSLTVDGFGVDKWNTLIAMMSRHRQDLIDTYNVYIWIHYVIYPILFRSQVVDPINVKWKTHGFGPPGWTPPAWMSFDNSIVNANLDGGDIDIAVGAVTSLGGPKLQAGRTAIGLVNSYPSFDLSNGIFDVDGVTPENPTGLAYQSFVPQRNASSAVIGQTDIDQADTTNVAADFSGRGSGNNVSLLAWNTDVYTRYLPRNWRFGNNPWDPQLVKDWPGNGPINLDIFPYPIVKNLWNYWVETYPPGYLGPTGSIDNSGAAPNKFMSLEGRFENVDIELRPIDENDTNIIPEVIVATDYDGITGEVPAWVPGASAGNPGGVASVGSMNTQAPSIVNTFEPPSQPPKTMSSLNHLHRDHMVCSMLAAQVIWSDHMGGPRPSFRGFGVINLTGSAAGVQLDWDRRDRIAVGDPPAHLPPNEGVIERPVVVLNWGHSWPLLADPNVETNPFLFSGNDRMPLWEIRWALDEQTLLDGGGTSINYNALTTGGWVGNSYPISGSRVAVSHGQIDPTVVWFTVLEWDVLERDVTDGPRVILKDKTAERTGNVNFFFPDIVPKYPTSNIQQSNKQLLTQDFRRMKHKYPDDVVTVSVLMAADPNATLPAPDPEVDPC